MTVTAMTSNSCFLILLASNTRRFARGAVFHSVSISAPGRTRVAAPVKTFFVAHRRVWGLSRLASDHMVLSINDLFSPFS